MSRVLKILVVAAVIATAVMAWKAATSSTEIDVEYET